MTVTGAMCGLCKKTLMIQIIVSELTMSASAMSWLMLVSYTPTRPYSAPAGFNRGPSMLKAVRTWGEGWGEERAISRHEGEEGMLGRGGV